jgi:hypothetical protein
VPTYKHLADLKGAISVEDELTVVKNDEAERRMRAEDTVSKMMSDSFSK